MTNLKGTRKNLLPYDYPEFEQYWEAIQQSYWLVTEYNFTSDVHEFHKIASDAERNAIKNAMLAISNIEVAVKVFWARVYDRFSLPEVAAVGMTFAESEVRHAHAYSHLLNILGLDSEFQNLTKIPALNDRLNFFDRYLKSPADAPHREYLKTLLLFSIFTEHISLFSSFYLIKAFQRKNSWFRGISNVIDATVQEETIHAEFGFALFEQYKSEFPEEIDDEFIKDIEEMAAKAFRAENKILDWFYEDGDIDVVPRAEVEAFIKHRFNQDLLRIGAKPMFSVQEDMVEKTMWFEEETLSTKQVDFFHKRPTAYSIGNKSFDPEDMF